MKVVYIGENHIDLTKGRAYDIIDYMIDFDSDKIYQYKVQSDFGFLDWYHKKYFRSIKELRNQKLNKINGL